MCYKGRKSALFGVGFPFIGQIHQKIQTGVIIVRQQHKVINGGQGFAVFLFIPPKLHLVIGGVIPGEEYVCFVGGCDEESPVCKNSLAASESHDPDWFFVDGMDAGGADRYLV